MWGHPPAVECGVAGWEAAAIGDWEQGGVMQGGGWRIRVIGCAACRDILSQLV